MFFTHKKHSKLHKLFCSVACVCVGDWSSNAVKFQMHNFINVNMWISKNDGDNEYNRNWFHSHFESQALAVTFPGRHGAKWLWTFSHVQKLSFTIAL